MKLINNLIIRIIPFLPKFFVKIVASPYIAGITDDEMLKNVKKLLLQVAQKLKKVKK